jgi:mannobiose 2-epimerase
MPHRSLLAAFALLGTVLFAQAPDPKRHIPELERVLTANILAFWHPSTLDTTHGGYLLNHDIDGKLKERPAVKGLVTQARQVWLFSRAARAGYGDRRALLDAAGHGYRFLREKMWDPENGGFYWQVDLTGAKKQMPKKHMYGQSFALYAISEYALATGRRDALEFATSLFQLLEAKAHDKTHGGYLEYFNEDWSAPAPDDSGYMSATADIKLMNTHLHLMEAMTTFYRASKNPIARERLLELMSIESNAVVRKTIAACSDRYRRDWTPILGGEAARVSYGHDLENIWLLVDAADAAGVPVSPYLDLFRENFAYSMKYGWDETQGGFFYYGAFGQPAANQAKSWWVQAEAMVSALTMYHLTRDPQYLTVFEKTWEFVRTRQIDFKNGEWFADVTREGKPRGDKAGPWKAGYHNGRAMIECVRILRSLP